MKRNSSRKYVDLFCSVFKKTVPDAGTPYFQEMSGVNRPLIFHQKKYHSITLTTTTKLIDFSSFIYNKPKHKLIAYRIVPYGQILSYLPFILVNKLYFGFIDKNTIGRAS